MKLEKYISDLLYRYECVIIPNFGGFITNRQSAEIDRDKNLFKPPYKKLLFNRHLKVNDGLLANYIAKSRNISFEEALQLISQTTDHWLADLESGVCLTLDKIGVLEITEDGTWLFTAIDEVNYLRESFGTNSVATEQVDRKPKLDETVEKIQEKAPIILEKARDNKYKYLRYAAVFVPLAALSVWGVQQMKSNDSIKEASITPITIQAEQEAEAMDESNLEIDNPLEQSSLGHEQVSSTDIGRQDEITAFEELPEEKVEAPVLRYHIIAGAFRSTRNAQKEVGNLQNQGFDARMAGTTATGLQRVAYCSESDRSTALRKLKQIKSATNAQAWLLTEDLN